MKNPFFHFIIILSIVLALAFILHIIILYSIDEPLFSNRLILAYTLNYLMAIGIYFLLYILHKRLKSSLGFLFMGGSLLKFIVFFLFFYGYYRADGDISRFEFAAFFVPYLACLVTETVLLAKMLLNAE